MRIVGGGGSVERLSVFCHSVGIIFNTRKRVVGFVWCVLDVEKFTFRL